MTAMTTATKTYRLENSKVLIHKVHNPSLCYGEYCTVHNRSIHNMRGFPQHWRSDRGIMERVNPFGGACPDPDSPWAPDSAQWVHGCIVNPYTNDTGMHQLWRINGVLAAWLPNRDAVTMDGNVWTFTNDYSEAIPLKKHRYRGRNRVDLGGTTHYVDALIAKAWLGEKIRGKHIIHVDRNPYNDCLENLEYQ